MVMKENKIYGHGVTLTASDMYNLGILLWCMFRTSSQLSLEEQENEGIERSKMLVSQLVPICNGDGVKLPDCMSYSIDEQVQPNEHLRNQLNDQGGFCTFL